MQPRRLLARLARGDLQNVGFTDFCRPLEAFGFAQLRTSGSHRIFAHPAVAELVNVQDVKGQAKPYQIRQVLRLVEQYNLPPGDRGVTDYHINIFYSDEDAAYVADIPDLDACSALGQTPEEALAEVETAKRLSLDAARETGRQVPPPRYRPAIYQAR
jgi:predicted RNase H-like HicB family nuclease/predicted RNA binding protein YcfA (HicA-like mRNA interferase family)